MINNQLAIDKRAIWTPAEDELILLIKVTALYFVPHEKSVPFKLIHDIMNDLMPRTSLDKKVGSFGRRIKILIKSKMNTLFVANKLELCKQDKEMDKKYSSFRSKIKRNFVDKELVDLYINFIKDLKAKYLKKRVYNQVKQTEQSMQIDLPDSLEEFHKKYKILNSEKDVLFKNQSSYYQQPKTDYEITCNTLHSAIHVSLMKLVLVIRVCH